MTTEPGVIRLPAEEGGSAGPTGVTATRPASSPAMADVAAQCQVCQAVTEMERYTVREMMYGTRDTFRYVRCAACGCLQIENPPQDLSLYYPRAYYAFTKGPERYRALQRPLVRARNRFAISGRGLLGRIVSLAYPHPAGDVSHWLSKANITPNSKILDVGCGTGELLHDLAVEGYRQLLGIDPFIETDITYAVGVRILKQSLAETAGPFDLIMLHHSLEHIPNQLETMEQIAARLETGGHCLIRIPVVPSDAWARYREDWVQIDAPRHFVIHSVKSLELLANKVGMRLVDVRFDSDELQFFGSEQYRRDIPLIDSRRPFYHPRVVYYRLLARRLNALGRGDQAAFLFVRG